MLLYLTMIFLQVLYVGINSEGKILHGFAIQQESSSSNRSSYTWSNLIQGDYQFSVVAFTSKGPGEAANLTLSTLPNNGKLSCCVSN